MTEPPSIPWDQPLLPRIGKAVGWLLLTVLVIGGGWEGFRFARLHLALGNAQREFSQRQFMRAEFWTGRALGVDEGNIQATRLMAEINEAQSKPGALWWRIKLTKLEPGNTDDIMAWAKCALRFGQAEMEVKALNSLPADFKDRSAEYHELMAGCALSANEPYLAEAHFARAAQLDRDNPVHRVNLAAFQLTHSATPEVRAGAARDLEGLLTDPRVSLYATRSLLGDAVRNGDHSRALQFAQKLQSLQEHTFSDDLACLEAVIAAPAFRPALAEIELRAQSSAYLTTETGDWLTAHGMAAEMLRWFSVLPAPLQANMRVQMTAAQAHLAVRDWSGLETFLAGCHWDDCEFLRRAMLIRCKRELSQPWETEWAQLATETKAAPPNGFLLAQMVIGWQWRNEALDLLWDAAARPQTDAKALQYLWDLYSRTGDTLELLHVAKAQIELDPTNPAKKNDYAFLSLLVVGASEHSERLAQEASSANPNIAEWAATYAYALHLAGKESEAKRVMERLPPEALQRPGVALYYAIVLAGNGDSARARESLAKLNPAGMLLEERKLAAALAQQLNVASR